MRPRTIDVRLTDATRIFNRGDITGDDSDAVTELFGLLPALGVGGVVLGLAGVGLYRRSLPKWMVRYRRG